jgi:hypothetical protein
MAITNFISTVWSENLLRQLDTKYIAVANSNREWEGDIKQKGDRVKILGVGNVYIQDYTKNVNLSTPPALNDTVRELVINQAKAFNFQIDDIDRAQATPKLMDEAIRVAANALANEADKHVYSLYGYVVPENTLTLDDTNEYDLLDTIYEAILKLQNNGVTDEIVLEVTPTIASLLLKVKLNTVSNNNELFENGCIGSIAGCKVFVSRNVCTTTSEGVARHKCFMRTKRAIAFAEQLSEIEAYRPELRFADAVKGLMLYGAKIVYPDELMLLNLGVKLN